MESISVPKLFRFGVLLACVFVLSSTGEAVERPGQELQEIGVSAELGKALPTALEFTDSHNNSVNLASVLEGNKPVIVIPAYYHCPRLCGLLLDGFVNVANELAEKRGLYPQRDYRIVTVSFNPTEGPELAREKELLFKSKLRVPEEYKQGWDFWVDRDGSSKKLLTELGFTYKKDKQDFAHTAAIFVVNVRGLLSQYFTGIDFPGWDLKLSLVDAAMGGVGSAIDHALLFCFRFDPLKGKYTFAISSMIKVVGALSLIGVVGMIVISSRSRKQTPS